ncbi:MAG: MFS transporter [Betaproteobacteria bacterium]|nr:MFS transporter [Betaproteobacteria bacterium]
MIHDDSKTSAASPAPRWWHRHLPPVWQNRDFRLLWISLTITHFGGQVTFLALPLTAALMLNASPMQMGILTAVEALPYTLFGLFTGVLIDRSRKLKLIILADIGRGLALLLVPVAAWFGFLSMPVLYIVGFLVGIGGIIGWAAYQVFMAERVGNKHLVDANSGIALSDSASQLVGPGLAGAIIHWLTAPIAILADALSFLFSAWILRNIPPRASDAPKIAAQSSDWRAIWAESKQGLSMILNHPVLRTIAFTLMGWNVLKHAYIAIVILYAAKDLALSPGTIGALFMLAGVGFLVATATIKRFNARFGVGSVMLGGLTATAVAWLLIAAVPRTALTPVLLGASLFVLDLGVMLFFINYLSLRQAAVPEAFRGRVTSTLIFIAVSLAPLGSLAGGALAEWVGLRATIAVCGAVGLVMGLVLFRWSQLPALRDLPRPEEAARILAPDAATAPSTP